MQNQQQQQNQEDQTIQTIIQLINSKTHKKDYQDRKVLKELLLQRLKRIENMTVKSQYGQNILDQFIDLVEIQYFQQGDFIYHQKMICDYVYIILDGTVLIWEKKEDTDFNQEQDLQKKLKDLNNKLKRNENFREQEFLEQKINEVNNKLLKYRNPEYDKILKQSESTHSYQYFTLPLIANVKTNIQMQEGGIVGENESVSELKFEKTYQVFSEQCVMLKMHSGAFVRIFDLQVKKVQFIQQILRNSFPTAKTHSLELLSFNAEDETFHNGEVIFDEEDKIKKMYIVREGKINMSKLVIYNNEIISSLQQKTVKGSKNLEIAHVTDGQFFGYENMMPRFGQKTKKREYKAKSNAIGISRLYSISKKLFIQVIKDNEDFKLRQDFYELSDIKQSWINQRIEKLINFSTRQLTQESFRKRSIRMQLDDINSIMNQSNQNKSSQQMLNSSRQNSSNQMNREKNNSQLQNSNNNNLSLQQQDQKQRSNSPLKKDRKSLLINHFINQIHTHIKEEENESNRSDTSIQSASSDSYDNKVSSQTNLQFSGGISQMVSPLKKRKTQIIPNFSNLGLGKQKNDNFMQSEEQDQNNIQNIIDLSQMVGDDPETNEQQKQKSYFKTYRKSKTIQSIESLSPIKMQSNNKHINETLSKIYAKQQGIDTQNMTHTEVPSMNIFTSSSSYQPSPRKKNISQKQQYNQQQSQLETSDVSIVKTQRVRTEGDLISPLQNYSSSYNYNMIPPNSSEQQYQEDSSPQQIYLQSDRSHYPQQQEQQQQKQSSQQQQQQQIQISNQREKLKVHNKNNQIKGSIVNYLHLINGMVSAQKNHGQKTNIKGQQDINMVPKEAFEKRQKFEKARKIRNFQEVKWQKQTSELGQKLLTHYKEKQKYHLEKQQSYQPQVQSQQQKQQQRSQQQQKKHLSNEDYLNYYKKCQTEPDNNQENFKFSKLKKSLQNNNNKSVNMNINSYTPRIIPKNNPLIDRSQSNYTLLPSQLSIKQQQQQQQQQDQNLDMANNNNPQQNNYFNNNSKQQLQRKSTGDFSLKSIKNNMNQARDFLFHQKSNTSRQKSPNRNKPYAFLQDQQQQSSKKQSKSNNSSKLLLKKQKYKSCEMMCVKPYMTFQSNSKQQKLA